jgi:hypothetical protein|nr:MAG TPA: hypothetical protein [Caudoviricetes sp.]
MDELFKTIKSNLAYYYKVKHKPKRCCLNDYLGLIKEPGYVVKLIHDDGCVDLLFIADERQKKQIYGYGFIIERSEALARRCLLLEDKAVKIIEKGLWI